MISKIIGLLPGLLLVCVLKAQMPVGNDTLYGNEWINYERDYLKIRVSKDGIYKITYTDIQNAGVNPATVNFRALRLFNMGVEQALYLSNESAWGPNDYLVFEGKSNKAYLDRYLYSDPMNDPLNPEYSLVTDTNVYFLMLDEDGFGTVRYNLSENDTVNLPAPEEFIIRSSKIVQSENFIKRPNVIGFLSRMSNGEGFSGPALVSQNIQLPTPGYFANGPSALLKLNITANNSRNHELQILWNEEAIDRKSFNNFQFISENYTLSPEKLREINSFSFARLGAIENRYSLAYLELEYPAKTIKTNDEPVYFRLNGSGRKHLLWESLDNATYWLLNSEKKDLLIESSQQGKISFVVSQDQASDYVLLAENAFQSADRIEKYMFEKIDFDDSNFIMIYHPDLRLNKDGIDVVAKYADHRRSSGYTPQEVNVLSLYNHFSYGIERHSIALRNYFALLHKTDTTSRHILLMGKGRDLSTIRTSAQLESAIGSFYIPTFGVPGADNLLVCPNHTLSQYFAIGRIPAISADEIDIYLDKVIAFETNQLIDRSEQIRTWQKRLIHISGGRNTAEQSQLRNIMDRLKNEIEEAPFAANVFSFSKQSSEPVQGSAPEQIYQLINSGLSMISFMGHSGSTTLDYDIDNLGIYTNNDKYPFFLALGCSAGNMYTHIRSYGERFNFVPNKGTILFFSSSGLGYPVALEPYAASIYKQLGESKGLEFGEIVRKVHHENQFTSNKLLQETIEQHNLNGDPALRFNYYKQPDYTPDISSLVLNPQLVSIADDSLEIQLDILNLGINNKDSIDIELRIESTENQSETFHFSGVMTDRFQTKFNAKVSLDSFRQPGRHTLFIELDPEQKIEEGPLPDALLNNFLRSSSGTEGFSFQISGNKPELVFPRNFEMISEERDELIILSGNPFSNEGSMLLDVDTTTKFSVPFGGPFDVNFTSGLAKYRLPFSLSDSTTYYWRVGEKGIGESKDTLWHPSHSFTVIKSLAKNGYGQFHRDQFIASEFLPDSNGIWRYPSIDRQYLIRNSIFSNASYPAGFYDGERIPSLFPFSSTTEGLVLVIFDPVTNRPILNPPGGKFGSINNSGTDLSSFPYNTSQQTQRHALIKTLRDSIETGSIVMLYSILRTENSSYGAEHWAEDSLTLGINLFSLLEDQGVDNIRSLEEGPDLPFVIVYRKNQQLLDFKKGLAPQDTVTLTLVVSEAGINGKFGWQIDKLQKVDTLGWQITEPAQGDHNFSIRMENLSESFSDSLNLVNEVELNLTVNSGKKSRLVFNSENNHSISHQLNQWFVTGEDLPDPGWVHISVDGQLSDTIQRGRSVNWKMDLKNFSSRNIEKVPVNMEITDSRNNTTRFHLDSISLSAFEEMHIEYELPTESLEQGLIKIAFLLDPDNTIEESNKQNNSAETSFYLAGDNLNPLLKVYFDGSAIMDGDIVSSKPEIRIELRDQNEYLRLADTSLFEISIKSPGQDQFTRIGFESPDIFFRAAEDIGKNEAFVIFKPASLNDGEHILQVQARDASGNLAGEQPYRIRFSVINKSMITSLSNYPNPFSTKTRFLYTLTGSQSPSSFVIQIYTLSGKLVREISYFETGPLRPGTNLTDYEWDGSDQYGNKLANGVYLFRLITRDEEGEQLEHFNSKLDDFSNKGWSKMVILR